MLAQAWGCDCDFTTGSGILIPIAALATSFVACMKKHLPVQFPCANFVHNGGCHFLQVPSVHCPVSAALHGALPVAPDGEVPVRFCAVPAGRAEMDFFPFPLPFPSFPFPFDPLQGCDQGFHAFQ